MTEEEEKIEEAPVVPEVQAADAVLSTEIPTAPIVNVVETVACGRCSKPKKPKDFDPIDPSIFCKCGRPTEYTEELLDRARAYADQKMPFIGDDGIKEVVHSIEGLAVYINIRRSTIYLWVKDVDKTEFLDIVEGILEKQGKSLVSGGLNETFSGSISKLMLTKHGYRDQVDSFNREVPVDPKAKADSDTAISDYLKNK